MATMLTAPDQHGRPLYAATDIVPFYVEHSQDLYPAQTDLDPSLDALLSDICISTTSVPVYFPAYFFKTKDCHGNDREFNLIDGGISANNPAWVALRPTGANAKLLPANVLDYGKYLVLSVGAGTSKSQRKYDAIRAAKWGLICWLISKDGNCPLIVAFTFANADMADLHLSLLFSTAGHINNYLRIQDNYLSRYASSSDKATKECMEELVNIGNDILQNPISRKNLDSCKYEAVENEGTNEQALIRFAKMLSKEKRLRIKRMKEKNVV